jgi:ABC-type thiamine transport system substrate-binding protein
MRKMLAMLMLVAVMVAPSFAQEDATERLTVYSGRNEQLIAPLLAQFTEATGVQVDVVYGDTAAIANQILEEGANSPADVYIAQDAGALGALEKAGALSVFLGGAERPRPRAGLQPRLGRASWPRHPDQHPRPREARVCRFGRVGAC